MDTKVIERAISIEGDASSVLIANTRVENLHSQEGAAIKIQKTKMVIIQNCTFTNNTAYNGGAIKVG